MRINNLLSRKPEITTNSQEYTSENSLPLETLSALENSSSSEKHSQSENELMKFNDKGENRLPIKIEGLNVEENLEQSSLNSQEEVGNKEEGCSNEERSLLGDLPKVDT
uniref:Uncharacterized protein n=1 Tax=Strongyloides venezuelensis TaxID=75913 RepID=A0A0K0F1N6_STRVS